jgi:hypothetical protein
MCKVIRGKIVILQSLIDINQEKDLITFKKKKIGLHKRTF